MNSKKISIIIGSIVMIASLVTWFLISGMNKNGEENQDSGFAAVENFLDRNPHFVVDSKKERYILTYNPKGFLNRIS